MKTCTNCNTDKPLTEFPSGKNQCKVCVLEKRKAYLKEYYQTNRDKIREQQREYKKANRDNIREYQKEYMKEHMKESQKEYRKANLDKIREYQKEYREANRGKRNSYSAQRRARKLQATPEWADKQYIRDVYENAREASEIFGVDFQVDHVAPLKGTDVCGLHNEFNLQVLEASKNQSKKNTNDPDIDNHPWTLGDYKLF